MIQKILLRPMSEKQTRDKPVLLYENEETGHLILFQRIPTPVLKNIYTGLKSSYTGWLYADELEFKIKGAE